jgi:hypothetical protein
MKSYQMNIPDTIKRPDRFLIGSFCLRGYFLTLAKYKHPL